MIALKNALSLALIAFVASMAVDDRGVTLLSDAEAGVVCGGDPVLGEIIDPTKCKTVSSTPKRWCGGPSGGGAICATQMKPYNSGENGSKILNSVTCGDELASCYYYPTSLGSCTN